MKKCKDGSQVEGVDYFIGGKNKYQKIILQRDKLTEFIRWYVVEGGRGQMSTADTQCSTELSEKEERYSGIYTLRRLQDALTFAHAAGCLEGVGFGGQNLGIKTFFENAEAPRTHE